VPSPAGHSVPAHHGAAEHAWKEGDSWRRGERHAAIVDMLTHDGLGHSEDGGGAFATRDAVLCAIMEDGTMRVFALRPHHPGGAEGQIPSLSSHCPPYRPMTVGGSPAAHEIRLVVVGGGAGPVSRSAAEWCHRARLSRNPGAARQARTAPLPSDPAEAVDRWPDGRKRLGLTGRRPLFCKARQPVVGAPSSLISIDFLLGRRRNLREQSRV